MIQRSISEEKPGVRNNGENRVFFFLDSIPQKQGSGASLRFYSNVRAYLDLGYQLEVVQISSQSDSATPSPDLQAAEWTKVIEPYPQSSFPGRLMFRAGIPTQAAVGYYIEKHPVVYREIQKRINQSANALFHLEGELMASALPWLPKTARTIWSLHDLPSTVSAATSRIACEAQSRTPTVSERRELRFARRFERKLARHASLILCIADYDCERLQQDWGCRAVEYLPLSIPAAPEINEGREWTPDGRLRLLHLGSISHLPSYRSLEFLFQEVWPKLPAELLDRISLDVVGTVNSENGRAQRILSLANRFTNVAFHGHVPDVGPYYRNSDLQIVASTDATGLRTRTIESFAYGLPVLSTAVGARGIAGINPGEHLIIANDTAEFVNQLSGILKSPERLHNLSMSGRDFYTKNQSRSVVALTLAKFLKKHFGM
jgi:glycosyltransferase involved in cell wall biosynthesis